VDKELTRSEAQGKRFLKIMIMTSNAFGFPCGSDAKKSRGPMFSETLENGKN
jgi:hypothetical protein